MTIMVDNSVIPNCDIMLNSPIHHCHLATLTMKRTTNPLIVLYCKYALVNSVKKKKEENNWLT